MRNFTHNNKKTQWLDVSVEFEFKFPGISIFHRIQLKVTLSVHKDVFYYGLYKKDIVTSDDHAYKEETPDLCFD